MKASSSPAITNNTPCCCARRLSAGVALLTFAQIPLGAVTVLFDLNPLLVMSHFLVAVVATGLAAALFGRFAAGGSMPAPSRLAWLARVSVPVAFGLIVSGTFVTAAGPHAGGEDIRRMGNLLDATYVHVRVAFCASTPDASAAEAIRSNQSPSKLTIWLIHKSVKLRFVLISSR